MPRALLIVNPYASEVSPERTEAVEAALARRLEVVTRETEAQGHAAELAAYGAGAVDGVVVFGGDGTCNEAINGGAGQVAFGFVPGGGANVLARALGLPRDPVAAAERVAAALAEGRTRSIGLGQVNGRRFGFSAGIGIDAEAVRRVEARGRSPDGRRAGNLTFATTVARVFAERRFHVDPQLEVVGYGRAAFVFVANGQPYTYAGPFPVTVTGAASFEGGLDFVAPEAVRPATLPRLLARAFRGTVDNDREVLSGHDLDGLEVRCDRPLPLQADGEDLGNVTEARFQAEREALAVLF